MEKGYIHIYTGEGKGKTTAALGLAIRALGAGFRVWIGQFAKGKEYSEHKALKIFNESLCIRLFGNAGFIFDKVKSEDIEKAKFGLKEAQNILIKGDYKLVILDEICIALHFKLLSIEEVIETLNKRAKHVEVILTGRNAPEELIAIADLVTKMSEIKHYFSQGVNARIGIEK